MQLKPLIPIQLFTFVLLLSACQKQVSIDKFKEIHQQVYKSITISDEGKLYDSLSEIFTHKQIEKHFNRIKSFQNKNKNEQIQIIIDEIEYKNILPRGESIKANWIVRGRIHHNGHKHQRSLEYQANYQFVNEDGRWKVKNSEIVEHQDFELTEEERELGQSND